MTGPTGANYDSTISWSANQTLTAPIDRYHWLTGGAITITLPGASGNAGKNAWFRNTHATNSATIQTSGGGTTWTLAAGSSGHWACDGTNWFKLA